MPINMVHGGSTNLCAHFDAGQVGPDPASHLYGTPHEY